MGFHYYTTVEESQDDPKVIVDISLSFTIDISHRYWKFPNGRHHFICTFFALKLKLQENFTFFYKISFYKTSFPSSAAFYSIQIDGNFFSAFIMAFIIKIVFIMIFLKSIEPRLFKMGWEKACLRIVYFCSFILYFSLNKVLNTYRFHAYLLLLYAHQQLFIITCLDWR